MSEMAHVNSTADGISSMKISSPDKNIFEKYRKANVTGKKEKMKECFDAFDVNSDGYLDPDEFRSLLESLFCNGENPYSITDDRCKTFFKLLDRNQDGLIDLVEFEVCWCHWLKQILDPVCALVVVDVQNDFISGTLAIKDCPAGQDGEAVVPVINRVLTDSQFDVVVYSCDWHPEDHISFIENVQKRKIHSTSKVKAEDAKKMDTVVFEGRQDMPIVEQKLWPKHCVQKTWGAKLHGELKMIEDAIYVNKGTNPEIDSYSAFWDNKKQSQTELLEKLLARGVTDVYTCGLAYDVCVGSTALHALEHGFRTVLIDDATRGVSDEDINLVKEKLVAQGAVIADANEIPAMVTAVDRRPELGYQAALNVALATKLLTEDDKP